MGAVSSLERAPVKRAADIRQRGICASRGAASHAAAVAGSVSIYTAAADTGDGAEGGTTTEGDEHLLGAGNTRAWGLAVQAELGQVLSVEATSNRDGDQSRATEGGGVYFVHRCC